MSGNPPASSAESRRPVLASLLLASLLFGALLFGAPSLPGQESPEPESTLVIARGDRLEQWPSNDSSPFPAEPRGRIGLVEQDRDRGQIRTLHEPELPSSEEPGPWLYLAHDPEGTLLFDQPLAPTSTGDKNSGLDPRWVLDADDGSTWIALGTDLWRLSVEGELELHLERSAPVVDLALEPVPDAADLPTGEPRGLWVASYDSIEKLDPGTGSTLRTLDLPQGTAGIRRMALALAPEGDSAIGIWIASDRSLSRFDLASSPGSASDVLEIDLAHDRPVLDLHVSSDGVAWLLTDEAVGRFAVDDRAFGPRNEISWRRPLGPDEVLTAWAFDSRNGSLWVAGVGLGSSVGGDSGTTIFSSRLARIGSSGETLEVSEAFEGEISALVVLEAPGGDPDGGDPDGPGPGTGTEETYTPIASPRGYLPNQVFEVGDLDAVDTNSGNVVVSVSLGQVYEVGPRLSYRFQAVNNSNAWDHIGLCLDDDCDPGHTPRSRFALTNFSSNAGLGWELHFGKLFAPEPASGLDGGNRERWPNRDLDPKDVGQRWLYVAPSGARHYLYSLPNRNNGTASLPVRYAKDGSFLRLQLKSSTEAWVESPDGLISVFHKTGNEATGTDFCGNGVSGCWRFAEKRDLYGNRMSVSYSVSGSTETWTVSDSTGRSHEIVFALGASSRAGGDGPSGFQTQDGDEWGDLRRIVTEVRLAAFGDAVATYGFVYETHTLARACPHDYPNSAPTLTTRLLARIDVPRTPDGSGGLRNDARPYVFDTHHQDQTACDAWAGRLRSYTLPTLGKVEYQYANTWEHPTRCSYFGNSEAETFYRQLGLSQRTRRNPDGSLEGRWTYDTDLYSTVPIVNG